jgi:hypothetical protein
MVARKTTIQSLPVNEEASHAAEPAFHELDTSLLALKETLFEGGRDFPPEEFILRINLWDEGEDPKNSRNLYIKIPSLSFINAIRFAERSTQQGWEFLQIGSARQQALPPVVEKAPAGALPPLPGEAFAPFDGDGVRIVDDVVADELHLARPFLEFGFSEEKP